MIMLYDRSIKDKEEENISDPKILRPDDKLVSIVHMRQQYQILER